MKCCEYDSCTVKRFMVTINCVTDNSYFHPSLIFEGMDGYPCGFPHGTSLCWLAPNLASKYAWIEVTLSYNDMELITTVKSFIVQTPQKLILCVLF